LREAQNGKPKDRN